MIQFIAAIAIFHQNDLKKGMNSYRPGAIHPNFHIVLMKFILLFKKSWRKIASSAKKLIDSAPQQQRRPLPSLLPFFFFNANSTFLWIRAGLGISSFAFSCKSLVFVQKKSKFHLSLFIKERIARITFAPFFESVTRSNRS